MCVCLSVSLFVHDYSQTTDYEAAYERYQHLQCHKGMKINVAIFFFPSIVMGSLLRRAHLESLRAAEAKNAATINQLKYRSRSCITGNIALGAWSRANKALGCASYFIGSRPRPRAIFPVMHSHGTLTSIYATTNIYIFMQ